MYYIAACDCCCLIYGDETILTGDMSDKTILTGDMSEKPLRLATCRAPSTPWPSCS